MNSLFEMDPDVRTMQDIFKRFKIKWKSLSALEAIKCPHCRKTFRQAGEDGLEELIYTLEPGLSGLTENSEISEELFETICSILRNDGLEKR